MFSWKKNEQKDEGDSLRSTLEGLAMEAGYSGTFSPFEEDESSKPEAFESNDLSSNLSDIGDDKVLSRQDANDLVLDEEDFGVDFSFTVAESTAHNETSFTHSTQQTVRSLEIDSAVHDSVDRLFSPDDGEASAFALQLPAEPTRVAQFKRAFIGGFSKSSVWNYVDQVDKDFTSMKNNYERQFRDIANERAQLSKERTLLHSQILDFEGRNRDLSQEVKLKQDQLTAQQDQISSQQEQLSSQQEQLISQQEHIGIQEEQIIEAERLNNEMNTKLEQKETELEEVTAKVRASEEQLYNMKATVSQLSAEIDQHASLCATLEQGIQERDERLAALEQAIQSLRIESSALSSRNTALVSTINRLEGERSQIAALLGLSCGAQPSQGAQQQGGQPSQGAQQLQDFQQSQQVTAVSFHGVNENVIPYEPGVAQAY